MPDRVSRVIRSRIMAKIRSKNTKPELVVFSELRKRGIYFQKHYGRIIGKPDVAVPSKKLAVFIEGDFWHGYKFSTWKQRLPEYWASKIERNIKRDRNTFYRLKKAGWKYLRIWEHEVKKSPNKTFAKIESFLTIHG